MLEIVFIKFSRIPPWFFFNLCEFFNCFILPFLNYYPDVWLLCSGLSLIEENLMVYVALNLSWFHDYFIHLFISCIISHTTMTDVCRKMHIFKAWLLHTRICRWKINLLNLDIDEFVEIFLKVFFCLFVLKRLIWTFGCRYLCDKYCGWRNIDNKDHQ